MSTYSVTYKDLQNQATSLQGISKTVASFEGKLLSISNAMDGRDTGMSALKTQIKNAAGQIPLLQNKLNSASSAVSSIAATYLTAEKNAYGVGSNSKILTSNAAKLAAWTGLGATGLGATGGNSGTAVGLAIGGAFFGKIFGTIINLIVGAPVGGTSNGTSASTPACPVVGEKNEQKVWQARADEAVAKVKNTEFYQGYKFNGAEGCQAFAMKFTAELHGLDDNWAWYKDWETGEGQWSRREISEIQPGDIVRHRSLSSPDENNHSIVITKVERDDKGDISSITYLDWWNSAGSKPNEATMSKKQLEARLAPDLNITAANRNGGKAYITYYNPPK